MGKAAWTRLRQELFQQESLASVLDFFFSATGGVKNKSCVSEASMADP